MPRLLCQRVQQLFHLASRGDALHRALRCGQVEHPRGIFLDDLIALGIAEHGGDHGEVSLRGGFVDVLSVVLALTQLGEHIFQRHRSELVEADAADHGIHHLQHSPVCGDGAGAYFVCRFSQQEANSSKVISPSSA